MLTPSAHFSKPGPRPVASVLMDIINVHIMSPISSSSLPSSSLELDFHCKPCYRKGNSTLRCTQIISIHELLSTYVLENTSYTNTFSHFPDLQHTWIAAFSIRDYHLSMPLLHHTISH